MWANGARQFGLWWLCTLLVAACIPVAEPTQLNDTPGPPVVVNDQIYRSAAFTVQYPAGWRVITSAAGDVPAVIFAAPDEVALIYVGAGSDPTQLPDLPGNPRRDSRMIVLDNGQAITAALIAQESNWEAALPLFEQVAASLQVPQV
ncbi:MAG: hypothetical protein K8L99_23940 [Anaerolineae bacterium]|nr:hypothetical protein [Anaerolineae bacterium]